MPSNINIHSKSNTPIFQTNSPINCLINTINNPINHPVPSQRKASNFFSADSPDDRLVELFFKRGWLTQTGRLCTKVARLPFTKISDPCLNAYAASRLNRIIRMKNGLEIQLGFLLAQVHDMVRADPRLKKVSTVRFWGSDPISSMPHSFVKMLFEKVDGMLGLNEGDSKISEILTDRFLSNLSRPPGDLDAQLGSNELAWEDIEELTSIVWSVLAEKQPSLKKLPKNSRENVVREDFLFRYWNSNALNSKNEKGFILTGLDGFDLSTCNNSQFTSFLNANFQVIVDLEFIKFDSTGQVIEDDLVVYAESQGTCIIEAFIQRGTNTLDFSDTFIADGNMLPAYLYCSMKTSSCRQAKVVDRVMQGFLNDKFSKRNFVKNSTKQIKRTVKKGWEENPKAISLTTFMFDKCYRDCFNSIESPFISIWARFNVEHIENYRRNQSIDLKAVTEDTMGYLNSVLHVPLEFIETSYAFSGILGLCLRPPLEFTSMHATPEVQLVADLHRPALKITFPSHPSIILNYKLLEWIRISTDYRYINIDEKILDILLNEALEKLPESKTTGRSVFAFHPELLEGMTSAKIKEVVYSLYNQNHPYFNFIGVVLLYAGYTSGKSELLIEILSQGLPRLFEYPDPKIKSFIILILKSLTDTKIDNDELHLNRDFYTICIRYLHVIARSDHPALCSIVLDILLQIPELIIPENAEYLEAIIDNLFSVINDKMKGILGKIIGMLPEEDPFRLKMEQKYLNRVSEPVSANTPTKQPDLENKNQIELAEYYLTHKNILKAIQNLIAAKEGPALSEEQEIQWIQLTQKLIRNSKKNTPYEVMLLTNLLLHVPASETTTRLNFIFLLLHQSYLKEFKRFSSFIAPKLIDYLDEIFQKKKTFSPAQGNLVLAALNANRKSASEYFTVYCEVICDIILQEENSPDVRFIRNLLDSYPAFNANHPEKVIQLIEKMAPKRGSIPLLNYFPFEDKIDTPQHFKQMLSLWNLYKGGLSTKLNDPAIVKCYQKIFAQLLSYACLNNPKDVFFKIKNVRDLLTQNSANTEVEVQNYELIRNLEQMKISPETRFILLVDCIRQGLNNGLNNPEAAAEEILTFIDLFPNISRPQNIDQIMHGLIVALINNAPSNEQLHYAIRLAKSIRTNMLSGHQKTLLEKHLQMCQALIANPSPELRAELATMTSFGGNSAKVIHTIRLSILQEAINSGAIKEAAEIALKLLRKSDGSFELPQLTQILNDLLNQEQQNPKVEIRKLIVNLLNVASWKFRNQSECCTKALHLCLNNIQSKKSSFTKEETSKLLNSYLLNIEEFDEGSLSLFLKMLPHIDLKKMTKMHTVWSKITPELCKAAPDLVAESLKVAKLTTSNSLTSQQTKILLALAQESKKAKIARLVCVETLPHMHEHHSLTSLVEIYKIEERAESLSILDKYLNLKINNTKPLSAADETACKDLAGHFLTAKSYRKAWELVQNLFQLTSDKTAWIEITKKLFEMSSADVQREITARIASWDISEDTKKEIATKKVNLEGVTEDNNITIKEIKNLIVDNKRILTSEEWENLLVRASKLNNEPELVNELLNLWNESPLRQKDLEIDFSQKSETAFWGVFISFQNQLQNHCNQYCTRPILLERVLNSSKIKLENKQELIRLAFQYSTSTGNTDAVSALFKLASSVKIKRPQLEKYASELIEAGIKNNSLIHIVRGLQGFKVEDKYKFNKSLNRSINQLLSSKHDFTNVKEEVYDDYLKLLEECLLIPEIQIASNETYLKLISWILTQHDASRQNAIRTLLTLLKRLLTNGAAQQSVLLASKRNIVSIGPLKLNLQEGIRYVCGKASTNMEEGLLLVQKDNLKVLRAWMDDVALSKIMLAGIKYNAKKLENKNTTAEARITFLKEVLEMTKHFKEKQLFELGNVMVKPTLDLLLVNRAFKELLDFILYFRNRTDDHKNMDLKSIINISNAYKHYIINITPCVLEKATEFYKLKIDVDLKDGYLNIVERLFCEIITREEPICKWLLQYYGSQYLEEMKSKFRLWIEKLLFSTTGFEDESFKNHKENTDFQIRIQWLKRTVMDKLRSLDMYFQGHEKVISVYNLFNSNGSSAKLYSKDKEQDLKADLIALEKLVNEKYPDWIPFLGYVKEECKEAFQGNGNKQTPTFELNL